MKTLLFGICAGFTVLAHSQQAVSYNFTATNGIYSSIALTGTASTIYGDDYFQTNIPIGFSFNYCGTDYTELYASSNGYLSLSNVLPSSGAPSADNSPASIPLLTGGTGLICPFWDDLDCGGRHAYYTTTGMAPNRIFIFEWVDAGLYGGLGGPTNDSLNFQVKLYETSNNIQFCYGYATITTTSATIAIFNSPTDFQTLNNSSNNPTPSSSTFTNNIIGMPQIGQVYNWFADSTSTASLNEICNNGAPHIYPNPVVDQLTIEIGAIPFDHYIITDLAGQILIESNMNSFLQIVDMRSLPAGIYFVHFMGNIRNSLKKIIKK